MAYSKQSAQSRYALADFMAWMILMVLALLPLHAVFTTWLGDNFGSIDLFRAWKEIIILGLAVGAGWLLVIDRDLRKGFLKSRLTKLIAIYTLLAVLRTLYGYQQELISDEGLLYGVISGLRYFAFFLVVWLVAQKSRLLGRLWAKAVLIPAATVIIFGLIQQLVLDKNFLTHLGYGKDTIPPYQAVDMKDNFIRAQSTLRGPNPLGVYLILIVTFIAGQFYRLKQSRFWNAWALGSVLILLFFSYSRSAWAGTALSLVVWAAITIKDKQLVKRLVLIGVGVFVIGAAAVWAFRNNNFVQNAIFHTDETSRSAQSSNQQRSTALERGLKDVWHNPLGQGLGSAGPASARNSRPKIAENYYIQIAQEVGVIGLFVYLAILLVVTKELFLRRHQPLAAVLLASLVGISAINLVSHAWGDDTISLLWWSLAAIALAPSGIIGASSYGKQKTYKKP